MQPQARTVRSRALRGASTDAERKLSSLLRGRKLGGFKFRRQFPIDRYFADFACVEAKLIVEADGASMTPARPMTSSGPLFWNPRVGA